MEERIFAREREIAVLKRLLTSKRPEFLAVYGRRRVGKTYLIREYFKDKGCLYFAMTGVKGASTRKQLKNFFQEFIAVFKDRQVNPPKNWLEALTMLRNAIEDYKGNDRVILFFDELPWIASPKSGFLEDLDYFWNRFLSADNRVILIVCGSAASWMIKKVIRNKGGLHGRLTEELRLVPFNLRETEQFLSHQGISLDRRAVIDIYMAIGGIPKYLNYVQRGLSSLQIISRLCFEGPLSNEFEELYASLFDHHDRHVRVVKMLAERPYGLTKQEIAEKTGLSPGGGMNTILEELELSGFILSMNDFGKQKKQQHFRLIDEYSLFYLRWSHKAKEDNLQAANDLFWTAIFNSPAGQSWAGLAFETICLKHLVNIKKTLGISGVLTSASSWVYKPKAGSDETGAQIDLLIDRADNCINICEIKYSNNELVISKSLDKELRDKKNIFLSKTKTKKSAFLTVIAPYGIKKNAGYCGTVDITLTMDALF